MDLPGANAHPLLTIARTRDRAKPLHAALLGAGSRLKRRRRPSTGMWLLLRDLEVRLRRLQQPFGRFRDGYLTEAGVEGRQDEQGQHGGADQAADDQRRQQPLDL